MTGYVRKDTSNNIADGNIINAADLDAEFDGVQDAFNSTTGHKHDGTSGEGAPITTVGPVQDVVISTTAVTPKTTNTVDLGSSSLKFKDIFIAGSATLPTVNATTVDTTNVEVTNIKAKDGTASATIANTTGVVSLVANPVLSGGTANGVAYLNGSKVLTTGSALTFDGTNLGIGTSSPVAKLHVVGNTIRFNDPSATYFTGFSFDTTAGAGGSLISQLNTSGYLEFASGTAANVNSTIRFRTANTERMRIDSSGNLGLGVTPSAWGSAYKVFEIRNAGNALWSSAVNDLKLTTNVIHDGTNYNYATTAAATRYDLNTGAHRWFTAPSGTAGTAITFTQAMTLDASGNLGLGATSLSAYLTLQKSSSSVYDGTTLSPSGVGNTLFIDNQDNTTGSFGQIVFRNGASGQVWNRIVSVRVGSGNGALAFVTGTSTAAAERARIDSSGNLLVGKTSTATNVAGVQIYVGTGGQVTVSKTVSGSADALACYHSGTYVGGVVYSNTTTSFPTSSDYRLKEDVQPMIGALEKVSKLKPVTYKWKSDGSNGQGFIAHELQQICPDAVVGEKDAVDAKGNPKYQGIDTSFLVATLTAAIQEQQAIIQTLTARIEALEAK